MQISIVGTGNMARGIATRALAGGHDVTIVGTERSKADGLGFAVMTDLGTAVFVSAGGYHHHVGVNVWRGRGVPPVPADAVGLRHWTLVVANADELAAVRNRLQAIGAPVEERDDGVLARDPSGTAVRVIVAR